MYKLALRGRRFKVNAFKKPSCCFRTVKQSALMRHDEAELTWRTLFERFGLGLGRGDMVWQDLLSAVEKTRSDACPRRHTAANIKCFLRGTIIAGGLYYLCARLAQKYLTFFLCLIAFSFLHEAGTITNSLEQWRIGERLVQWPFHREHRLEASRTDARGLFCCFFDIDTFGVETSSRIQRSKEQCVSRHVYR